MSDFRFACPSCGQRIIVDSAHRGREINCPDCQKPLTIPQIRAPAPAAHAPERAASASKPDGTKLSALALASLVCSTVLGIGCIPGIICGHLARARLRRNPALQGKGMANAGLIISYAFLLATTGVLAFGFLVLTPKTGRQLSAKEKAANTKEAMASRVVDQVDVGNPESEEAHGFKSRFSRAGTLIDKKWRDASNGGSFSYDLKVDPVRPMSLYCTYWGNDAFPGRKFDIIVNSEVIATQELNYNDPGHYFDVEYKIPTKLTRGTNLVTVMLQAYPGKFAGGLFAIQTVKR
jgi:Family of unknown function (DUF6805)/Domain of unknown function (DUF4190)